MKYGLFLFWAILAITAGTVLFHTSDAVQKTQEEIERLESEIAEERESIRVLKAEWAYLNQPERLEKLAREYLPNLSPASGTQLTEIGRLPEKEPQVAKQEPAPTTIPATPAKKIPADFTVKTPKPAVKAPPAPAPAPKAQIIPSKNAEPTRDFGDLLKNLGGSP